MKILHFHAENFKKLKVVDITPPQDVVEFTGDNRAGKSSALDAIQMTLGGLKSRDDIPDPIRHGAEKAVVKITLGDPPNQIKLIARRTWRGSSGTSELVLENAEGAEYKGAQGMLDKIIGKIAFNPAAFADMDDKEQLKTLLQLVKLPIDLKEHAAARQVWYDARTKANRDLTDIEGQIKLMAEVPAGTPDEELSAAAVLEEQEKAQAILNENNEKRRQLQKENEAARETVRTANKQIMTALDLAAQSEATAREKLVTVNIEIDKLEQMLRDKQMVKESIDKDIREYEQKKFRFTDLSATLTDPDTMELPGVETLGLVDPDLTIFKRKLEQVEETNRQVRIKKKHAELKATFKAKSDRSAELTAEIATLDKIKSDALAAAEMPIEGLSFDDNGVKYNGIPFSQCSTEERDNVSVAMAAAMNPTLRVIFVRDASLMVPKRREVLKEFARKKDLQLWMELADDSGKVGIVFEEGMVVPVKES